MCVTQAGVAELRRAVGVEEREQLVGKVDPLLPLDQSLLHIWTEKHLLRTKHLHAPGRLLSLQVQVSLK